MCRILFGLNQISPSQPLRKGHYKSTQMKKLWNLLHLLFMLVITT